MKTKTSSICCTFSNERSFTAQSLETDILAVCGQNYNPSYFEIQKQPISEALYLIEQWLTLHQELNKYQKQQAQSSSSGRSSSKGSFAGLDPTKLSPEEIKEYGLEDLVL